MANEKILVVDDDTNICELLRLYLTKEGYQVTTANDGEEGLEKFNQLKPDMVLLDVDDAQDGRPRGLPPHPQAGQHPVMMLTAKGETFDKVLGLELGADDYMVKPFDTKEVVARIKAVLRRCTVTTSPDREHRGRHRVRQPRAST
ncbi:MAG: response regulator [Faecalibacterium prausnitzii]